MKVIQTPLDGLNVVQSGALQDTRGAFVRLFCARELQPLLGDRQIAQINHSRTNRPGVVRGLHFQYPPRAEMKMVRCLRGRVWDVAVDIRADSPTFLEWYAQELMPDEGNMMVIPEGFAHGFQALEPESELLYLHTDFYHPLLEGGLRYNDPRLNIPWPLTPQDLSPRDLAHPVLTEAFSGVVL